MIDINSMVDIYIIRVAAAYSGFKRHCANMSAVEIVIIIAAARGLNDFVETDSFPTYHFNDIIAKLTENVNEKIKGK